MISIDLGTLEYFDGLSNEFVYEEGGTVRFEYSLKVLYDWEAKWKKPFLKGESISDHELQDFYMMMALDPIDERYLTDEVIEQLSEYIKSPNTATTFSSPNSGGEVGSTKPKVYTSEEIYALMFSAGVDIEFENRNLNRLLTVLKIISSYNSPPKKMSKADIMKQNAQLNAQRKQQLKTKG